MNTQETLSELIARYEFELRDDHVIHTEDQVIAYCLAVIARSLTR